MKFLDAHTHLQLPAYDTDRDAVILRARAAGVRMVHVGTQTSTSQAAIELAEKNDDMWATVGFHPSHCNENWHHDPDEQSSAEQEIFNADTFRTLAVHPKVVAIGECGLDYFRMSREPRLRQDFGGQAGDESRDKEKQKKVFLQQIDIAIQIKKPLMIHCRDAFPDLIEILSSPASRLSALSRPGIIHFFTGTVDDARKLLDLGFAFTFGGAITFPPRKGQNVGAYDDVIKFLPLDAILSETDAPYVAPAAYRGQRNEPAYVVEVVKKLAELKNISVDQMAEQINKNAERVLGI